MHARYLILEGKCCIRCSSFIQTYFIPKLKKSFISISKGGDLLIVMVLSEMIKHSILVDLYIMILHTLHRMGYLSQYINVPAAGMSYIFISKSFLFTFYFQHLDFIYSPVMEG